MGNVNMDVHTPRYTHRTQPTNTQIQPLPPQKKTKTGNLAFHPVLESGVSSLPTGLLPWREPDGQLLPFIADSGAASEAAKGGGGGGNGKKRARA